MQTPTGAETGERQAKASEDKEEKMPGGERGQRMEQQEFKLDDSRKHRQVCH